MPRKKSGARQARVNIEYRLDGKDIRLPFVVGVMADVGGKNRQALGALSAKIEDRKFRPITRETFNEVMKVIVPKIEMDVENLLTDEGLLRVELEFEKLEDFEPDTLMKNIPAMQNLLEKRAQLKFLLDMLLELDGKTRARETLEELLLERKLLEHYADK